MWQSYLEQPERLAKLARGAALVVIFLLGVAACLVAIITGNLGLFAAGTTLFGLIGIAKA